MAERSSGPSRSSGYELSRALFEALQAPITDEEREAARLFMQEQAEREAREGIPAPQGGRIMITPVRPGPRTPR